MIVSLALASGIAPSELERLPRVALDELVGALKRRARELRRRGS